MVNIFKNIFQFICVNNKNISIFALAFEERHITNKIREISSVGSEHLVYTEGVGGSSPSSPTIKESYLRNQVALFSFIVFIKLDRQMHSDKYNHIIPKKI